MNLQTLPDGQFTEAFDAHASRGREARPPGRFSKVPLAVSFSEEWNYGLRTLQPETFETLHQRSRSAAGNVHSSRELRRRMRGSGEEQAGPQLYPARGKARLRGPSSACRACHRAGRRRYRVVFDRIVRTRSCGEMCMATGSCSRREVSGPPSSSSVRATTSHASTCATAGPRWSPMPMSCRWPSTRMVIGSASRLARRFRAPLTSWTALRATLCHRGRRLSERPPECAEGRDA